MGKRKEAARNASWFELLEQDRWWRQADGSMIRVDAMELSHIYSVLSTLERQAPRFGFGQWSQFPTIWMRRTPLYQALFAEAIRRVEAVQW